MNQCPECKTYKKADNCISCYKREKKARETGERTIAGIRKLMKSTPFMHLKTKLMEFLEENLQ